MSEDRRLRIHAQIIPDSTPSETAPVRRRMFRRPPDDSDAMKTRGTTRLSIGDRMLRNTALACALLLAVLAMGNINQPWAVRSSETVRRALTMHIDLDDSLGQLSFVRNLIPESALVFLNVSGSAEMARPADGELVHAYSDTQPWLLFECPGDADVSAVADGTVTAVSELSGGTLGLLIDHGNGVESVYAYLSEARVQAGDAVTRGQSIGRTAARLYFELREGESAVDPTERMGL